MIADPLEQAGSHAAGAGRRYVVVVVIIALGERLRRYSELLERVGGISKRMLTQTLHKLERNGLVERAAP